MAEWKPVASIDGFEVKKLTEEEIKLREDER